MVWDKVDLGSVKIRQINSSVCGPKFMRFLRATAVPAGTAEARISYGNSVCPSVCHDPVVYQAQVR